ncbi:MAG: hypothetical protein Q4C20_01465 [Erysipelotrichaceae bacterium]|nr:hypothetical protein [Erysipelotrichaceae bacterium]
MNEFDVRTDVLMNYGSEFRNMSRRINNLRFELSSARSRLFGVSMLLIKAHLLLKNYELLAESRKLCNNGTALNDIATKYMYAENHILQFEGELSNPAFDDEGQYGGDQGSPRKNWEAVVEIVRRYYPNMSNKEIRKFLETMNSEGCGYVAMINTLFLRFKGREDEFERIFGFPMYVNGDLNYDALVTDYYCAYDNPNESGASLAEHGEMFEAYCRDHNIDVTATPVQVTAENFNELRRNGEIVVGIRPVILYDAEGRMVRNNPNAGHGMTVTGVTDDGRLIVSSWGDTYYLSPDLSVYDGFIDFTQVSYN